ncbi:TetR/AcrR family transcriptional regulator [Paenibacillus sp. P96]|uniref:TetR/AcrR family transcriptional regulator n=1 Tax=Paenibacillus zeirhizosphaerae TaxID=2987519 RepID=A0ABT9FS84_9BACL|nr:TetR/AcrR family transcriptional regulator [Paenibacillus sp. P96]MDP4097608.1 TetR/AcrR family transcriptional regulator [Paenibacillus sp. P96]
MPKDSAISVSRQTEIVSAAIEVFAELGYYRATTAKVAERANISQPYIFKFFATKEELLREALKVSWMRITDSFTHVVSTTPSDRLEEELISAYARIMYEHRNEVLLQMQAQTIMDASIIEIMREGFSKSRQIVHHAFLEAGIPRAAERTMLFLARGMLCNISMSLDIPELMNIDD